MNLSKNIILFSVAITSIFFIDMIRNYQPNFASDWNTHWAYLAGTTFGIIDEKWVFPNWVYAPWYYMFCSYIFGPIFFLAYKINIIDVREAAMYTMLFGSFFLKLITIIGSYKFSKVVFKNKYYASLFSLLVVVLPFGNKAFYDHASETFGIALLPWCIYFLIVFINKEKIKYLFFYLLFLGLGSTVKMNILVPFVIFVFIFVLFYFNNIQLNHKIKIIAYSLLSIFLFLLISKIVIGNWLWENSDIRNFARGYGEPPNISLFLTFTPLNFIKNDITYPTQYFSYWNSIYYDFFSDYFQWAFLQIGLELPKEYVNFKLKLGATVTIVFFIYFFSLIIINFLKNKKNYFTNFFNLSFFCFFVLSIAYSYFVFHPLGGSWNLRYYGIFIYPLAFVIINNLCLLKKDVLFKLNQSFIYFIIIFSIFQRLNF